MHKLLPVLLAVIFCSNSLYADGNLYMEEGRFTTFMPVESIIDGWSLTSLAHNPSQLVFVGKDKQIQMQYELQSLKQEFYNPDIEDNIHTIALWDQNLFPNFNFGVMIQQNTSLDPFIDNDYKTFKSISLSSSFKEIVSLGITYNSLRKKEWSSYRKHSFNVGITGQYEFLIKKKIKLKPIVTLSITNWLKQEFNGGPLSSGNVEKLGGCDWGYGVESSFGKWFNTKHSFEFQKFGGTRFFNQSLGLTPFFTLFHRWGRNARYEFDPISVNNEIEASRKAWSGFSFQFNLQKFQSLFDINKVPKRFNLDVAYNRFGFGGWINKKSGFDHNNNDVRSYTNQFSIGFAFLPERDKK